MTKKVFLAHNACLNAGYDLNVLRSGIQSAGHTIVESPEDADEIVFSGCSVREHWVDDAISQLGEAGARAPNARIVVTGCIANTSGEKVQSSLNNERLVILPVDQVLLENTPLPFSEVDRLFSQSSGSSFESTSPDGLHNLRTRVGVAKSSLVAELEEEDRRHGTSLVQLYRQTTKGFVFYDESAPCEMMTVTRSCLYRCSFCNIPQGRGKYTSVPLGDILAKANDAVARGRHHLVLIGDEVGNYGIGEAGPRFIDLVDSILQIAPTVTLSIRYIEPKPFLKNFQKLLAWAKMGRIQLLYISLQSGSPRVLKAMRRGYDIAKVAAALNEFRSTTSTVLYGNWLVGFPEEQEDDFQATTSLVKELDFQINVAIPFSARPGTPAYSMEHQVQSSVVHKRVAALTELAAEMKAEMMRSRMSHIESGRREELISMIRHAEHDQYSPPPPGSRRAIPALVLTQ